MKILIELLSTWAKNIILAVIIISILEMILPNNKTKKYVKMVMGIYLLFNIISPMVKNKDILDISKFNLENFQNEYTSSTVEEEVNQESMDKRIRQIYIEELENDIETKLENQGYIVNECKVEAQIDTSKENSGITKIRLDIEKANEESEKEDSNQTQIESKNTINQESQGKNNEKTNNQETANKNSEEENSSKTNNQESNQTTSIEEKLVSEIQKIKKVEIGSGKTNELENQKEEKIDKTSIQKIKKFLIEEYGVNEKCLEIN